MKQISVLIKPASSLCNIRCKYCFYDDVSSQREVPSHGKMQTDTVDQLIENVFADLEDGDKLNLAFQGGEPTIAGLDYFRYVVSVVSSYDKQVTVQYALQTNGLLINEAWCEFLKEHQFLVGLSIDGDPAVHDMNRVDSKGRGTYHKVIQTKKLFDRYNIEYNILCVLTNSLAKEPDKVYQFLRDQSVQYVQFVPCLDDLNAKVRNIHSLTPHQFASFYLEILKYWLEDLSKGNLISIKLFDDIINLLVQRKVTSCGMMGQCQIHYVIESDGSVYPCDFYALDEYRMGNIKEQSLRELFEQNVSKQFLCSRTTLPNHCAHCPFLKMCRGGCKRMNDAMFVDEKSSYCGYQSLLEEFIPKIEDIIERVKRRSLNDKWGELRARSTCLL